MPMSSSPRQHHHFPVPCCGNNRKSILIRHQRFSFLGLSWRGIQLITRPPTLTIQSLIKTAASLRVRALHHPHITTCLPSSPRRREPQPETYQRQECRAQINYPPPREHHP